MHLFSLSAPYPESTSRSASGLRPYALLATVLATAPAVLLYRLPATTRWAEYDRAQIASGELWRGITSHWAHWNGEHLFLDVIVFGILTAIAAHRSPRRLLAALAMAALGIPLALWIALPQITIYRGLSGLDAALFALVCGLSLRESLANGNRPRAVATACALTVLAAKILFELATGDALFVDQVAAGFVPVPLAHGVGGCAGLVAAFMKPRA